MILCLVLLFCIYSVESTNISVYLCRDLNCIDCDIKITEQGKCTPYGAAPYGKNAEYRCGNIVNNEVYYDGNCAGISDRFFQQSPVNYCSQQVNGQYNSRKLSCSSSITVIRKRCYDDNCKECEDEDRIPEGSCQSVESGSQSQIVSCEGESAMIEYFQNNQQCQGNSVTRKVDSGYCSAPLARTNFSRIIYICQKVSPTLCDIYQKKYGPPVLLVALVSFLLIVIQLMTYILVCIYHKPPLSHRTLQGHNYISFEKLKDDILEIRGVNTDYIDTLTQYSTQTVRGTSLLLSIAISSSLSLLALHSFNPYYIRYGQHVGLYYTTMIGYLFLCLSGFIPGEIVGGTRNFHIIMCTSIERGKLSFVLHYLGFFVFILLPCISSLCWCGLEECMSSDYKGLLKVDTILSIIQIILLILYIIFCAIVHYRGGIGFNRIKYVFGIVTFLFSIIHYYCVEMYYPYICSSDWMLILFWALFAGLTVIICIGTGIRLCCCS